MPTDLGDLKLFVGLVTFEKGDDTYQTLAPEDEGAVGWMAGRAQDAGQFGALIEAELGEMGLRFVEVEDVEEISGSDDVGDRDEHLAENMESWEAGHMTVWGMLYCFVGEGEA